MVSEWVEKGKAEGKGTHSTNGTVLLELRSDGSISLGREGTSDYHTAVYPSAEMLYVKAFLV